MPYTVKNPPERIKDLPEHAQEIWVAAFNSAWDEYNGDESKCNAVAWAAVKLKYKQDKDGKWVALDENKLETVDISDVEILAVGKWNGHPKEVEFTKEDLDDLVKAFNELAGNEKLNYEPPVKLGHDDSQNLLQKDGYPAAGWVKSLKRVGDKLIASFAQVPRKLGDIIKAGGYKKVSSEVNSNYEIGGKTYPWVLKAVSLLGADIPAVKSIQDIVAQYKENKEQSLIVLYESGSPGQEDTLAEWDTAWINNLDDSCFAYIEPGGEKDEEGKTVPRALRHLPYKGADGKVDLSHLRNALARLPQTNLSPEEMAKARAKLVAAAKEAGVGDYKESEKEDTEKVMETELRKVLGIDEKADILATVKALKEKAEVKQPETVSLAEYTATKEEVKRLTTALAERDRDKAVADAIAAGKITPAQKAWADTYAMSDPKGFGTFVAAQPVIVNLGEKGHDGGGDVQLTETEIKVAEKMGVSKEDLLNSKKAEAKK
jgi:cation transport regulator ChaB